MLSEKQCLVIIKGKAFKGGYIPPRLEHVVRRIAGSCQGLPLAANVVGGILHDRSEDEWCSIEENWRSGVGGDENDISKILKLSFHHLPAPSLKKCFAYCSVLPKGARIQREQLIQLWMSEGFLKPSETSDMEVVGNQFFNFLLHNSLLQVVNRDENGVVEVCSMHDLVHDVACSISDGIYYRRDESSQIPKEQAKWLRTLIYNAKIGDIIFSDFKSLHSLTLMDCEIKELPDSIKELIHLRYLDISGTKIENLPDSIGELYHLQTIRSRVDQSWSGPCLKKMPSTTKYLCNLRHLYIACTTELPPQLGMLTSLQTLRYFNVDDNEVHRIVELESLKNLKGKLEIRNLEKVQDGVEASKACLFQMSGIVSLVLRWGRSREGEKNDENVLKGLKPHLDLKKLEIDGYKGASFPSWTLKMAVCLEGRWVGLNNLMQIRLENCEECDELPSFGHLPNLKFLYLSRLKNVKSINSAFYGIDNAGNSGA